MQATQRPVDFAFPKVGPVGILGRPLSGSRIAANPTLTNGRKGPFAAVDTIPATSDFVCTDDFGSSSTNVSYHDKRSWPSLPVYLTTLVHAFGSQGVKGQSRLMTNLSVIPARPSRMRAALRRAIDLRVKQGLTISAACEEAGMSTQGYHKAMKRPEVRDHLQAVQMEFVASVESEKDVYKARAYEVGLDLMLNSKSEAVRARMVEFFASDGKVSPVSVHIDARQTRGYEYASPEHQVVKIVPTDHEAHQSCQHPDKFSAETD